MGKKKQGKNKGRPAGPTMAEQADRHELYQRAVQSPAADVEFFTRAFADARGGKAPLRLREDFCGTALLATAWCASDPRRTAIGVDLDGPTLTWGLTRNVAAAGPEVASRVSLVEGDVRSVTSPAPVDVVCAMNFSYCVFKDRAALRDYFEAVRRGLNDDGVFVAELYGGTEAIDLLEEDRIIDDDLTYVWEQERFNPLDHSTTCHIHFVFSDDSRIDRAFTYEWRLWTLPEMRELLLEAGFREVKIYWEEVEEDEDDEEMLRGTGEYSEVTTMDENQESWLVYVVAIA
ncbi:MAG: class I SAM-dependent methyltransferase [Nannocystaceae bacterium]